MAVVDNPISAERRGVGGGGVSTPPLCFYLNNLKTADIRTLKLLHFFNIIVGNIIVGNIIVLESLLFF